MVWHVERGAKDAGGRFATRRGGFTLIELLVVIAIIGIMMGLLMVAVGSARQTALRAQCRSQMKQIGLAIELYIEANGGPLGVFPYATSMKSVFTDEPRPSLVDALDMFIEHNTAVYECPEDEGAMYDGHRYTYFEKEGLSYEYQPPIFGFPRLEGKTRDQARKSRRSDREVASSEVLVAVDFGAWHGTLGTPAARNALYMDWHVEGL